MLENLAVFSINCSSPRVDTRDIYVLENTERDQSAEIATRRKDDNYGGIKNHNAKIRCVRLGLNSWSGAGMAGRKIQ